MLRIISVDKSLVYPVYEFLRLKKHIKSTTTGMFIHFFAINGFVQCECFPKTDYENSLAVPWGIWMKTFGSNDTRTGTQQLNNTDEHLIRK